MNVSGNGVYSYSPVQQYQNVQDLNQDQKDTIRETAALKAGKESKEAQLDAYVAGTQQYNETEVTSSESTATYTQNYTDFAADVSRANNYATLVENGVDLSESSDNPTIQPIENPLSQDQTDALREGIVSIAGYQSNQDQIDAYKAGSQESANNQISETQEYVQNFNEAAHDIKRSESLQTYIEFNNYLVG